MNALVATRKRLRHVFERKKRCTRAWWRRSFDWRKNKYSSELFQHCFASKRWGHWQNYFCMQGIHVYVAGYFDNCLKKSKFVVPVRTGHIESILIRIKMVFNWMYVQPFFLCITTYENERIYQNIWIVVHTKRKWKF